MKNSTSVITSYSIHYTKLYDGEQYQSVVFYVNDEQKAMVEKYMGILRDKGYKPATQLRPADIFWAAEDYHQQYYEKKNGTPYCHVYRKIF